MREPLVFAIPGDLETPSGGYAYDRRLIDELERRGRPVTHLALPAGYPAPSPAEKALCEAAFADLPDETLVLVDGLAFGAMATIATRHGHRLRFVALVHHPLAREAGLSAKAAETLAQSETAALAHARAVIVTSPATARTLVADFAVPEGALTVAAPGVDAPDRARVEKAAGEPATILAIGSLIPRKDHATLIEALSLLGERSWRARIVGSATADPATADGLAARIDDLDLCERVTLSGATVDIEAEYAQADIFALASRYEGYGMVFAEAMVRRLPIVACESEAVSALVPREAGALVPPGDAAAMAAALARLLDEPETRRRAGEAAGERGATLPDWTRTASLVDAALQRLATSEVTS